MPLNPNSVSFLNQQKRIPNGAIYFFQWMRKFSNKTQEIGQIHFTSGPSGKEININMAPIEWPKCIKDILEKNQNKLDGIVIKYMIYYLRYKHLSNSIDSGSTTVTEFEDGNELIEAHKTLDIFMRENPQNNLDSMDQMLYSEAFELISEIKNNKKMDINEYLYGCLLGYILDKNNVEKYQLKIIDVYLNGNQVDRVMAKKYRFLLNDLKANPEKYLHPTKYYNDNGDISFNNLFIAKDETEIERIIYSDTNYSNVSSTDYNDYNVTQGNIHDSIHKMLQTCLNSNDFNQIMNSITDVTNMFDGVAYTSEDPMYCKLVKSLATNTESITNLINKAKEEIQICDSIVINNDIKVIFPNKIIRRNNKKATIEIDDEPEAETGESPIDNKEENMDDIFNKLLDEADD